VSPVKPFGFENFLTALASLHHYSKKKHAGISQKNKSISISYLAIIISNSKQDIVKLII